MTLFDALYQTLDPLLIASFRLPESPLAGYYLGTGMLALACVILGLISMELAYLFNRNHYEAQEAETVRMHNLSIRAIAAKDKESYKAANSLANESFGRGFFAGAALFSVSLWPAPFALGWMDSRFAEVKLQLPGTGLDLGYTFVFIGMYIVLRILVSRLTSRLPLLSRLRAMRRESARNRERMLSWADLGPNPESNEEGRCV